MIAAHPSCAPTWQFETHSDALGQRCSPHYEIHKYYQVTGQVHA